MLPSLVMFGYLSDRECGRGDSNHLSELLRIGGTGNYIFNEGIGAGSVLDSSVNRSRLSNYSVEIASMPSCHH